jgi:hypothetical protein
MDHNCNNYTQDILLFRTDIVNKCLTEGCEDCTGSYRNDLLQHRIICHCECHSKKRMALESVEGPLSNARGNNLPFQDGTQNDQL